MAGYLARSCEMLSWSLDNVRPLKISVAGLCEACLVVREFESREDRVATYKCFSSSIA